MASCYAHGRRPTPFTHGTMLSNKSIKGSVAILRVSRQVYAESYDVFIKGNRFVHVCSKGGVHLVDYDEA
jgi:hypothetical protein